MKTSWYLAAATVLLVNYINAREVCQETYDWHPIDCAGKGEPLLYKTGGSQCAPGCKVGNEILSCNEIHPPPNSPEYKHAVCKDKTQAYDCAGRGNPKWEHYDDDCKFNCLVGGDMHLLCEQIHSASL